MTTKILITGAAGQVGQEIVDLCNSRGLHFTAYTSSQLDITDAIQVMYILQQDGPTHVINAAAYTAVDKAEDEKEKAFSVNAKGPENLALGCKAIGAKLIHISTDYVFDGEKEGAYTVDDTPNPTSVYGASKLAGEKGIANIFDEYFILRVSWVFGQYGNNFVKTMLRLAEIRGEISVVNDQFGAPTPASNIASCLLSEKVLKQYIGIEHLESNLGVTWYEFAQEIFTQAENVGLIDVKPKLKPISSAQYPTPAVRPKNSKLNGNELSSIEVKDWRISLNALLKNLHDVY